jgi:hypothetical protein
MVDAGTVLLLVVLGLVAGIHLGWDSHRRQCKKKHPDVYWYKDRAHKAERRVVELAGELDDLRWRQATYPQRQAS